MKRLLLFLTCFLTLYGLGRAADQTVTLDLTQQSWSTNTAVATTASSGPITISFSKAGGQNDPTYYTSGSSVRCYANNTVTISSTGGNITNIEFTWGSTTSASITPNTGTLSNNVWTGDASSIEFKLGASGQRYIQKIVVTYASTGGGTTTDPEDPKTYTETLTVNTFTNDKGNSYSEYTYESPETGIIYYAQMATNNGSSFQFRSNNSNSGLVTTSNPNGLILKSVSIKVYSGSNTADFYGKNSNYETAANLYATANKDQGTSLGSLSEDGTIDSSAGYTAFGLRSKSGALYLSEITLVWEKATSGEVTIETPVISCENNLVTITCNTDGAKIYYTLDGSDPSDSSDPYTAPFNIEKSVTVKAIAYNNGEKSAIASYDAKYVGTYNGFKALMNEGEKAEGTVNGPITAVYQNGSYLYVVDNNKYPMLVYGSTNNSYTNGDQISYIKGTYSPYKNLPEITDPEFGTTTPGTAAVEPIVITANEATLENLNTYVLLKGVSLSSDLTITDETGSVALYSRFSNVTIPSDYNKEYDVTGFVSVFDSTIQIYPTEFVEIVDENQVEAPVFTPGGGYVEEGTVVKISCPTDDAIVYYTINGEDPDTSSTLYTAEGITINETTTIKAIATKDGMKSSDIVSATFTVLDLDPDTKEKGYILVTNIEELGDEAECIIVSGTTAMSTNQKDNNRGVTTVEVKDKIIIPGDDVALITIEKSAEGYTLKATNGTATTNNQNAQGYLYPVAGNNYLRTSYNNTPSYASISFNDDKAEIKFTLSNESRYLRYNSNSSLFSCYTSGQTDVQIYKKITISVPKVSPELSFELNGEEVNDPIEVSLDEEDLAEKLPKLNNPYNVEVIYSSNDEDVATIDQEGNVTLVNDGNAKISATFEGNDTYNEMTVSYELVVLDPNSFKVTFDFTDITSLTPSYDPESETPYDVTDVKFTNAEISLVTVNNGTGQAPRLYKSGNEWDYRIYNNNVVTISAKKGYLIESIEFKGSNLNNDITYSPGEFENYTWSAEDGVRSMTISRTANNNTTFQTITVYYEKVKDILDITVNEKENGWTQEWEDAMILEGLSFEMDGDDATDLISTDEVTFKFVPKFEYEVGQESVAQNDDIYSEITEEDYDYEEGGILMVKFPCSGVYEIVAVAGEEYSVNGEDEFTIGTATIYPSTEGATLSYQSQLENGGTFEVEITKNGMNYHFEVNTQREDAPDDENSNWYTYESKNPVITVKGENVEVYYKVHGVDDVEVPPTKGEKSVRRAAEDATTIPEGFTKVGEDSRINLEKIAYADPKTTSPTLSILLSKNGAVTPLQTTSSDPMSEVNIEITRDDNVAVGVATILGVDESEVEVYNLNGVRMSNDNLQPGIYIVKSGKEVRKVIVK